MIASIALSFTLFGRKIMPQVHRPLRNGKEKYLLRKNGEMCEFNSASEISKTWQIKPQWQASLGHEPRIFFQNLRRSSIHYQPEVENHFWIRKTIGEGSVSLGETKWCECAKQIRQDLAPWLVDTDTIAQANNTLIQQHI